MLRPALALLVVVPGILTSAEARAELNRCATADADLAVAATELASHSADTGWFPSGFPAQLRITGRVAGQTAVAMGLRPILCWTKGMQATLPGRAATGGLDVTYGAELRLYAHIDTTVLGYHVYWDGEIPIPFIPEDLIIASSTTFDPVLGTTVSGADTTDAVPVLFTDLISDLISITGISGGLHVDVVGSMVTRYTTMRLVAGGGSIAAPDAAIEIARPGAGFGPGLQLEIIAEGTTRYEPTLTFNVGVDVRVLGIRVVDYTLLGIPLALPAIERTVRLTGDVVRIPLPELGELGEGARLDFASGTTQELPVRNRGEAPLMLALGSAPTGIAMTPLVIAPGASATVRITASAEALASGLSSPLIVATNDPDHATLSIALGVDVGGSDMGMDDHHEAANAAGCSVGGNHGLLLALAFVAIVISRRRR